MAKKLKKELAIKMRNDGMSYSSIRNELGVSKSSLSLWLRDFPLSKERMVELRDFNPQRIEKYKLTMKLKRERGFDQTFEKISKELGILKERDLLIGGLFLYWGEGTKSAPYTVAMANTDPSVLKMFIKWLKLFNIKKDKLKVKLHLYEDMNIEKETIYWANELQLPMDCFRKAYIKKSKREGLTYKSVFSHGTCNVIYHNKEIWQYTLMGLKYIREQSVL